MIKIGQYFLIANLDKKEFIHPHDLNTGAKLWEICSNNVGGLLLFLLRQSCDRGGGDIREDYKFAGRWANNRIIVVGDYDESKLYSKAKEEFRNISKEANKEFVDFIHS